VNYQLKIHGYGYQYLFFDEKHYFTIALKQLEIDLNEILFDSVMLGKLSLYNSDRFLIDEPYIAQPSETGFLYGMDLFSRLEVKPKAGKRIKFRFYELRNDELLFSFPNVTTTLVEKKGILVLEKCMGYFGRTSLTTSNLKFDDLKFELIQLKILKENLIGKIYYQNRLLDFDHDELICQSKRVFIL
jgi:hypothetical protein